MEIFLKALSKTLTQIGFVLGVIIVLCSIKEHDMYYLVAGMGVVIISKLEQIRTRQ